MKMNELLYDGVIYALSSVALGLAAFLGGELRVYLLRRHWVRSSC